MNDDYVNYGQGHRESQEGKSRLDLVISPNVAYEDQLFVRYGNWLARGAAKYGEGNMRQLEGEKAEAHAIGAAFRHLVKWALGEEDEDHASAVIANLDIVNDLRYGNASVDYGQPLPSTLGRKPRVPLADEILHWHDEDFIQRPCLDIPCSLTPDVAQEELDDYYGEEEEKEDS